MLKRLVGQVGRFFGGRWLEIFLQHCLSKETIFSSVVTDHPISMIVYKAVVIKRLLDSPMKGRLVIRVIHERNL